MSSTNEEILPVAVEAAAVIEEKRYEWQPTDEDGRPIGAKQVIKYTTEDEFRQKFTEMQNQLIRKLRNETKKNRLGILETETIEDTAPRLQNALEFKPRTFSNDERAQLSRDILDPDTFDTAVTTIFEAATGVTGEGLRNTLTSLQEDNSNLKAQREVDKFLYKNPEYVVVPENFEAITNWMVRYNLAPVAENFQKAYDTLKASDLLVTSLEIITPVVTVPAASFTPDPVIVPKEDDILPEAHLREEIPLENQIPLEPVIPVVPVEAKPVISRVPTGLNNSNSASNAPSIPIGEDIVYEYIQKDGQGRQIGEKRVFRGLAAVNAMPSEEYKRRMMTDKGFTKKVEKLEKEAALRRRG